MTIFSTENFRGRLFFISNNLDDLFVPIIARSWEKNSNLKIVGELIEKILVSYMNGKVFQKFLAFLVV